MASTRHVCTGTGVLLETFHFMGALRLAVLLVIVKLCTFESGVFADDTSAASSSGTSSRSKTEEAVYFDQLYAKGVKAYNDQLWYKCSYNLEKAIEEYRKYKETLTDCRMACKTGEKRSLLRDIPSDLEEFSNFGRFLKHADCFRRCKSEAYDERPGFRLSKQVEETFEKRKPYSYLQFCWYKLDRLKQAASGAYTFYLVNPEDDDMRSNIAYYRDKAKVPEADFIDLELKPYKEHYIRAMLSYEEEEWEKVAEEIELSLAQYFLEEERCRVDCEDTVDDSDASHFSGAVANHLLQVLECQLGCEGNLSIIYSQPLDNFLSEQYHYLQYSYYKTDKISEAVEATASYLLFHPEDNVVKANKLLFMKKYQYSEEQFVPRENVREYLERRAKLRSLLDYLRENLMVEYPDVIFVTEEDTKSQPLDREPPTAPTTDYETWMDRYERLGLHLIAKDSDLKRKYRFAADGLLKKDQCDDLLLLMEDVPVNKKGVQLFTLEHARETLIGQEETYEASLRLFMRATEVLRHYTQRYYNVSGSLYFRHTNIVCWHQLEAPDMESDCIPQEFGTCVAKADIKASELVEDQFTTVTFLNSLDDADVYFLAENVSTDTSLGMKSGRTIGFQSGDRHGLNVPSSGRRCSLVITYTTYRSKDEYDYISTIKMLHRVEEIRKASNAIDYKEVMESFEKSGVHVTKNGAALKGGERVLVDGLASEAECSSLKNMVLSGALVGDGYEHLDVKPSFISPHTEHEMFQGLTLYRASKLMHMGLINIFSMKTFLDLSEKSRLYLETYFKLTSPLYFDFTHLVCRSAIDETKTREDLSHPVHADNCVLQPNGTCLKEYPAFVQRDYSALVYLNDDFGGGEFFFAFPNKTAQTYVRPKCGRMVGFNAAEYHGVKAVESGVRCALALWFTMNPNFKELAHIHAKKVLRNLQKTREQEEAVAHQKTSDPDKKEGVQNSADAEGTQTSLQSPASHEKTGTAADKEDSEADDGVAERNGDNGGDYGDSVESGPDSERTNETKKAYDSDLDAIDEIVAGDLYKDEEDEAEDEEYDKDEL